MSLYQAQCKHLTPAGVMIKRSGLLFIRPQLSLFLPSITDFRLLMMPFASSSKSSSRQRKLAFRSLPQAGGLQPLGGPKSAHKPTERGRNSTSNTKRPVPPQTLSLIHISEPTRLLSISYAVFCLKKKNGNWTDS